MEEGYWYVQTTVYECKSNAFLPGKHRKKLALVRSLICDLRWTIVAAAVPRLCLIGFKFAQPFFIDKLIQFVSSEGHSELSGAKYGLLGAAALIYIGLAVWSLSKPSLPQV